MRAMRVRAAGALAARPAAAPAAGAPGSGRADVVASFYPLLLLAERIAGRYNDVVDLTPPGRASRTTYELTVRQVGPDRRGAAWASTRRAWRRRSTRRWPTTPPTTSSTCTHRGARCQSTRGRATPRRRAGRPATRTSGRTRRCWPRSPRAFASTMAEADPAHAADYRTRGDAAGARPARGLDRDYAPALATCRIRHARGQPRRLRVPRPALRPRRRAHRRALPRRRAVAASTCQDLSRPDPGAPT